jgi:hypothetical protein
VSLLGDGVDADAIFGKSDVVHPKVEHLVFSGRNPQGERLLHCLVADG